MRSRLVFHAGWHVKRDRGHGRIAARFDERVHDTKPRIALIRQVLIND